MPDFEKPGSKVVVPVFLVVYARGSDHSVVRQELYCQTCFTKGSSAHEPGTTPRCFNCLVLEKVEQIGCGVCHNGSKCPEMKQEAELLRQKGLVA